MAAAVIVPWICALTMVSVARAAPAQPSALQITAGPVTLSVPRSASTAWLASGGSALDRAEAWLGRRSRANGDGIAVRLSWTRASAQRVLRAIAHGRAAVVMPEVVAQVVLQAPALRQLHRNSCETTALAIALRGAIGPDALQARLPRAAPSEPRETPSGLVWGDPELGFVGDVDRRGYGVYELPLLAVAKRSDPLAHDLTRRALATVLAALRDGHPIIAWVTLGASEPFTWRTPQGRLVRADHAEHAIALTGWTRGLIAYVDPWDGRRKLLAVADLAARWLPLGRRAISLAARSAAIS